MNLNLKKQSSLWIIAFVVLATVYNVIPSIIYYSHDNERPLSRSQVTQTAQFQLDQLERTRSRQENWLKQIVRAASPKAVIAPVKGNNSLFEITLPSSSDSNSFPFEQSLAIASQFQRSYFPPIDLISTSNPNRFLVSLASCEKTDLLDGSHLGYISSKESGSAFSQNFKAEWKHQLEARLKTDLTFMAPAQAIEYLARTPADKIEEAALKEALTSWADFNASPFKAETKKRWSQWIVSQFSSSENTFKEAINHLSSWKQAQEKKELSEESSKKTIPLLLDQAKTCLADLEKLRLLSLKDSSKILHPIISSIECDEHAFRVTLNLYADAITSKDSPLSEALESKLFEISSLLEKTNLGKWSISSTNLEGQWLPESDRLLFWNLKASPSQELTSLTQLLKEWKPIHPSFQLNSFKIYSLKEYQDPNTKAEDKITCLVLDAERAVDSEADVYLQSPQIIFKGFQLLSEGKETQESSQLLKADLDCLVKLLRTKGYELFPEVSFKESDWTGSALFCQTRATGHILQTNGLAWQSLGLSPWISLGVDTYGSWARQLNSIDDKNHSQLIQSVEDIQMAKNQMKPVFQPFIISAGENITWENFKLSWRKIMRGDPKKIVKWGLDLSGGRTVRVALTDEKGDIVTSHDSLLQARNELVGRVNRMGLSEVAARVEGTYLVLDFPSSQGFSSKELIQATRLSFHVVNEKFSGYNSPLFTDTQEFLNQVWSQAQISRQVDKDSLNAIASSLLDKASKAPGDNPLKRLVQAGLTINPRYSAQDLSPFDAPSMIVPVFSSQKPGQIDQLLIVFTPNALQGSDLNDVRASFDQQHGNVLTFEVKSSSDQGYNPQSIFNLWTKNYSQEEADKELLQYSHGRGWRMAVVMNDEVISSPTLSVGLKDRAMVHGRFTQRETARLASDLKAGSLTFTPKILSEENISPELGRLDRDMGIQASILAMLAVGVLMIGYYNFAGAIAFAAVIVNLFIIWAILQNLSAALTLPGLAGIVLTVGMAVDANVLVFERIREELKALKSLKEAIELGYKRAFSAILDSNLTTILAALILIQFDSGPVKGFAISLIIGMASSMFTALFMTRVFFEKWSESKSASLKLRDWIGQPKISFLKSFTIFTTVSALIALTGFGILIAKRHEIIGMDFVGGYGFHLEPNAASAVSSKEKLIAAFKAAGLKPGSYDVRELSDSQHLKVYLSHSLDEQGQLFNGLSHESERMQKVADILPIKDLEKQQLSEQIEKSWNAVSGQLSQTMRTQAALGLSLALLGILFYLTVRFEWTFALTSVIALVFDILVSLGCMGWLKAIGLPMQFDLQAVGAIMAIIGYALNDKIIVFDRIREEKRGHTLNSAVIESALRQTLSRTLMTSSTTLLVLLVLDILGGPSLLSFSMIMTLGVFIGTMSSLWFAPWILNKLSQKSAAK